MAYTCKWCGKTFDPMNAGRGGVSSMYSYCSKRCETAAKRSQKAQDAANAAARKETANKVKGIIKKLWN